MICRRYTKYSDKVEDWQQRLSAVNQSYKKAISGQMFSPAAAGKLFEDGLRAGHHLDVLIICRRQEEQLPSKLRTNSAGGSPKTHIVLICPTCGGSSHTSGDSQQPQLYTSNDTNRQFISGTANPAAAIVLRTCSC